MNRLLSCEFNIDNACVELKYADGSMVSIDCTAVENEVADNMYQRSELDWLIYNDPAAYADLILKDKASRLCGHEKCSYRRFFVVDVGIELDF